MCFSRGLKVHELQLWGTFNRNISLKLLNMGLCKRSRFIRVRGPQSKKLRGMSLRSEANSRIRNGWPEVRHGLGQGNHTWRCPARESPKNMQKDPWENESSKEHGAFSWQSSQNLPTSLPLLLPTTHLSLEGQKNSSYWVREKEKESEGQREEIVRISFLKAGGPSAALVGEQWGES